MKLSTKISFVLFAAAISLASCGSSSDQGSTKSDTMLNKPAPDNSAATNPSMADTMYSKDSTGKIPDTSHRH